MKIISLCETVKNDYIIQLNSAMKLENLEKVSLDMWKRFEEIKPNECAMICFTSGTTGKRPMLENLTLFNFQ